MQLVDAYQDAIPVQLYEAIKQVVIRTGRNPISVYRGDDAAPILNKYGKHTQRQLWEASPSQRVAWGVLGTPNPPGRSTHECRSDGVAYRGPVGRVLDDWQCGMDWPNDSIARVMATFTALGHVPFHPYASGVEYHHVNLLKQPWTWFLPLRRGSSGIFVYVLSSRLKNCGYFPRRTSTFTELVGAVVGFQHKHHLRADGIVGPVTWLNVKAAERWCLKNHRTEA